MEPTDRLTRQLDFIAELDQLKNVERMIRVIGGARKENSAEHSWHLGLMAHVLAEYAPAGTDVARAQTMVLLHDVVEIDAGDAFCFDEAANVGKEEREHAAAQRLFGMLPGDQADELRACWEEFEEGATPEARFAVALDRFQALVLNGRNDGGTWKLHDVPRERILERMAPIRDGAPALWPVVLAVVDRVRPEGL